ncbi:hypothetical protein PC116_g19866 [Phytophthora cactorum]|nr:hypothetical protein Pcac1_g8852 [Phytophthora cactorum]KAG2890220.1 hypothetical protein PC114_g17570 [Phytophthora cactorum]KAG4231886.1 hypothetical protein PC116_g19866 [Phytophthora cactorum]
MVTSSGLGVDRVRRTLEQEDRRCLGAETGGARGHLRSVVCRGAVRENMPDVVRLGSPVLFRALCRWMTALPRASPPKT